jgi:hypothetical protein
MDTGLGGDFLSFPKTLLQAKAFTEKRCAERTCAKKENKKEIKGKR